MHAWFERVCGAVEPEHRIDRYLLLPDTDSLGAKLRGEDWLELKLRSGATERMSRHGAVGAKERWAKWSLRLADPRVDELLDHSWATVEKLRWQRRFGSMAGLRRRFRPDDPSSSGGAVEVAALDLGGEAWWTLAFESFGAQERLDANFDMVTRSILGRQSFPRALDQVDSFGYPRWLADRGMPLEPEGAARATAGGVAALVRGWLPSL